MSLLGAKEIETVSVVSMLPTKTVPESLRLLSGGIDEVLEDGRGLIGADGGSVVGARDGEGDRCGGGGLF